MSAVLDDDKFAAWNSGGHFLVKFERGNRIFAPNQDERGQAIPVKAVQAGRAPDDGLGLAQKGFGSDVSGHCPDRLRECFIVQP